MSLSELKFQGRSEQLWVASHHGCKLIEPRLFFFFIFCIIHILLLIILIIIINMIIVYFLFLFWERPLPHLLKNHPKMKKTCVCLSFFGGVLRHMGVIICFNLWALGRELGV